MGRLEDQIKTESSRKSSSGRRGSQDGSLRRRHGDLKEGVAPMKKERKTYHYIESGLDNVFLASGFEYANQGKTVIIHDIEGLQRAIANWLVRQPRRLSGDELRFLRSELLLSQSSLAKILGVKELTIGRWERGESDIPLSTDAVVRMMFLEMSGTKGKIKKLLEEIADLDDEIDRRVLTMRENSGRWAVLEPEPEPEAA